MNWKKLLLVIVGFLILNLVLNRQLVGEVLNPNPLRSIGGDTIIEEYFAEKTYQKIIHLQNPFQFDKEIFYPQGMPIASQDIVSANAYYFLLFRPFLTIHQSYILAALVNFFLAELLMFVLLRKFKVDFTLSFILALSFAFAPPIVWRIRGHFGYLFHFLFPLGTLLLYGIYQTKSRYKLTLLSVSLGITLMLFSQATMYYLVMFLLLVSFFLIFYLLVNRGKAVEIIKINISKLKYGLLALLVFLVLVSPRLLEISKLIGYKVSPYNIEWGGAYAYLAKPWDLIIPSPDNYFYGPILSRLNIHTFSQEGVLYPGVITLLGLLLIFRYPQKRKVLPITFIVLFFYLLTWGYRISFKKLSLGIFPDWYLYLPYAFLHKLPLISSMRTPIRYGIPMVFSGIILAGFTFNLLIVKFKPYKKLILFSLLLLFLLDQSFQIPLQTSYHNLPLKSYQYIRSQGDQKTVWEFPFVIRDGFVYLGSLGELNFIQGQLIHNHSVIGGYIGRIGLENYQYFLNNPTIFYYGNLIDQERKPTLLKKPDYQVISNDFNNFNVGYVLVRKDLPVAQSINTDLKQLGFKQIISDDSGYSLYEK